jgi:DNA-repair protein XRCC4
VLRQEQASPVLKSILDHAVSSTCSLQDRITQLEKDNLRLVHERKAALERLEQCTHLKEQLEREMYSKFKLVLNEKKGKIRRLLEELASHQSTPPPTEGTTGPETEAEQRIQSDKPNDISSHHTTSSHSLSAEGLLGEAQEVVSPVKRRKREPRQRGARVPNIPHPPSIVRPPTTDKVEAHPHVSHGSSSAEGDDLLQLL